MLLLYTVGTLQMNQQPQMAADTPLYKVYDDACVWKMFLKFLGIHLITC